MFCDKFLRTRELYRTATILALITVGYNLLEGVVSVAMGAADETLSLFGFGLGWLAFAVLGWLLGWL